MPKKISSERCRRELCVDDYSQPLGCGEIELWKSVGGCDDWRFYDTGRQKNTSATPIVPRVWWVFSPGEVRNSGAVTMKLEGSHPFLNKKSRLGGYPGFLSEDRYRAVYLPPRAHLSLSALISLTSNPHLSASLSFWYVSNPNYNRSPIPVLYCSLLKEIIHLNGRFFPCAVSLAGGYEAFLEAKSR